MQALKTRHGRDVQGGAVADQHRAGRGRDVTFGFDVGHGRRTGGGAINKTRANGFGAWQSEYGQIALRVQREVFGLDFNRGFVLMHQLYANMLVPSWRLKARRLQDMIGGDRASRGDEEQG